MTFGCFVMILQKVLMYTVSCVVDLDSVRGGGKDTWDSKGPDFNYATKFLQCHFDCLMCVYEAWNECHDLCLSGLFICSSMPSRP